MKELFLLVFFFSFISNAYAQEFPSLGVKVETVADNLTIPWSIDWSPTGIVFFTERHGDLRIIEDGILAPNPILSLNVAGVEGGMLGVAVDPNFLENQYIYVYYTEDQFLSSSNKVVRYVVSDAGAVEDKIIIENIPAGPFHDGGRIQFGPDQKLYITTGDAGNVDLSQDLDSYAGKILRINSDGTIPQDNPWPDSPIYSIGHRNPQGIDWDDSGNLVATEHGPSGWRGSAHDEINVILPGKNYGWPDVIGDESLEGLENPILHTGDETWAPSGSEFYDSDKIPQWSGKYFVATLRGSHLHMIDFDLKNNVVVSHEKLFENEFGRLRDVQTGPDGFLYLLTSNKDGRGLPQPNDDKILKIIPMEHNVSNFMDCLKAGNPITESIPKKCTTRDGKQFFESSSNMPSWFKHTAKWWSMKHISDQTFSTAIEFLLEKNVITISSDIVAYDKISESELPSWLRENIGNWSRNDLSDDEFSKNILWMVENQFIKINK